MGHVQQMDHNLKTDVLQQPTQKRVPLSPRSLFPVLSVPIAWHPSILKTESRETSLFFLS